MTLTLCAWLAMAGCGAKTGLLTPDVPIDRPDVLDVPPRPPVLCVEPSDDAGVVRVNLDTRPQLSVADVVFLIDNTGSMDGEIDNIKANLQRVIIPQIAAAIGDVHFGVATYADFPISPYGDRNDRPFEMAAAIDPNPVQVQGRVNSIVAGGGGDNPEAMVEALYQLASGAGYAPWINRASPCATPGRIGYACLRREALPIFILIADAPSHNGPGGRNPYESTPFLSPTTCPPGMVSCRAERPPHRYEEALAELNRIGARVIGINSGSSSVSGVADLTQIARDTGAVTAAGAPLVINIRTDGADLDSRVVSAVQTFTRLVRFNASARVLDLDPLLPATRFVRAVRPVAAAPMESVQRTDATTFYGVVPGTRLTFGLEFVSPLPRTRETQRVRARVQFFADNRANLGFRDVELLIPPENGTCDGEGDAGTALDAGM